MDHSSFILPPALPAPQHSCILCRTMSALPSKPLCASCDSAKEAKRMDLSDAIQAYEDTFYASFQRIDEDTDIDSLLTIQADGTTLFDDDEAITNRIQNMVRDLVDDQTSVSSSHIGDTLPAPYSRNIDYSSYEGGRGNGF